MTPPFPRRQAHASLEMGGSSGPPHFPGVVEGVIQVSAFDPWANLYSRVVVVAVLIQMFFAFPQNSILTRKGCKGHPKSLIHD